MHSELGHAGACDLSNSRASCRAATLRFWSWREVTHLPRKTRRTAEVEPQTQDGRSGAKVGKNRTSGSIDVDNSAIAAAPVIDTAIKVCKGFDDLHSKALQAALITLKMHRSFASAHAALKGSFLAPVRIASR